MFSSVFDHIVLCGRRQQGRHRRHRAARGAHVVRHPRRSGQGAAIQTGVEYARRQPGAQVFATFDADGQHRLKDVIAMIDRLSTEDVDMVVAHPVRRARA